MSSGSHSFPLLSMASWMAAAVAGSASAIGGTVAVVSSGSSTTGVEPIITVSLAGEPSSLHAAINSATLNAAITVRFIRLPLGSIRRHSGTPAVDKNSRARGRQSGLPVSRVTRQ